MNVNPLTPYALIGAYFFLAGLGVWIAASWADRPKAKPALPRPAAAVRESIRVVRHGQKFCPDELRNATQSFCGGLRA